MLKLCLQPGAHTDQFMAMGEQLADVALLRIWQPQAGKALLHQQGQNMARVSLIRLLLANVTGTNLGRIPNPQGVAALVHQQLKPAGIPRRFHANQRRPLELSVKLLRLPAGMHQLLLLDLLCLCIQNRNLLVARVKITAYNLHKAPLLPRATRSPTKVYRRGHWGLSVYPIKRSRGICSSADLSWKCFSTGVLIGLRS